LRAKNTFRLVGNVSKDDLDRLDERTLNHTKQIDGLSQRLAGIEKWIEELATPILNDLRQDMTTRQARIVANSALRRDIPKVCGVVG
jgi:hypothetical protein